MCFDQDLKKPTFPEQVGIWIWRGITGSDLNCCSFPRYEGRVMEQRAYWQRLPVTMAQYHKHHSW